MTKAVESKILSSDIAVNSKQIELKGITGLKAIAEQRRRPEIYTNYHEEISPDFASLMQTRLFQDKLKEQMSYRRFNPSVQVRIRVQDDGSVLLLNKELKESQWVQIYKKGEVTGTETDDYNDLNDRIDRIIEKTHAVYDRLMEDRPPEEDACDGQRDACDGQSARDLFTNSRITSTYPHTCCHPCHCHNHQEGVLQSRDSVLGDIQERLNHIQDELKEGKTAPSNTILLDQELKGLKDQIAALLDLTPTLTAQNETIRNQQLELQRLKNELAETEQKSEALTKDLEKASEIQESLRQEIQTQQNNHASEIQHLEARLQDLKGKHQEENNKLREDHSDELAKLRQQHEDEKEALKRELNNVIGNLESQLEEQKAGYESRIEKLETKYQTQKEELEKQHGHVLADLESQLKRARSQHQLEIDELKKQISNQGLYNILIHSDLSTVLQYLHKFKEENQNLREQLAILRTQQTSDNKALEGKEGLKKRAEDAEKKVESFNKILEALEEAVSSIPAPLVEQLDEAKTSGKHIIAHIHTLLNQNKDLKKEVASLREQIALPAFDSADQVDGKTRETTPNPEYDAQISDSEIQREKEAEIARLLKKVSELSSSQTTLRKQLEKVQNLHAYACQSAREAEQRASNHEQTIGTLRTEVDDLKAKVKEQDETLGSQNDEILDYEKRISELNKTLEKQAEEIEKLKEEIKDQEQGIAHYEKKYNETNKLFKQTTAEAEQLKNRLDQQETECFKHHANIEDVIAQVQKIVADMQQRAQDQLDEQAAKHASELERLRTEQTSALNEQASAHEKARQTLQQKHDQETAQLKENFQKQCAQEQLDKQANEYSQLFETLKQETDKALHEKDKRYDAEKEELQQKHNETTEQIKNKYQNQITTLEAKVHSLEQEAQSQKKKMDALRETKTEQIDQLKRAHKQTVTELEDEIIILRAERKAAQDQLLEVENTHSETLRRLQKEHEEKLTAKDSEYLPAVQELKEGILSLKSILQQQEAEYNAKIQEQHNNHQAQLEEVESQYQKDIKGVHEENKETIAQIKTNHTKEIAAIEKRHASVIEEIRQELLSQLGETKQEARDLADILRNAEELIARFTKPSFEEEEKDTLAPLGKYLPARIEQLIEQLTEKNEQLEKINSQLEMQLEELKEKDMLSSLEENSSSSPSIEALQLDEYIQEFEQEIDKKVREITSLERQVRKLEQELEKTDNLNRENMVEYEKRILAHKERINTLEKSKENLEKRCEEYQKKLGKAIEDHKNDQRKIDSQAKRLLELETLIDTQGKEQAALREEGQAEIEKLCQQLQQEKKNAAAKISDLENKLLEKDEEIKALQRDKNELIESQEIQSEKILKLEGTVRLLLQKNENLSDFPKRLSTILKIQFDPENLSALADQVEDRLRTTQKVAHQTLGTPSPAVTQEAIVV